MQPGETVFLITTFQVYPKMQNIQHALITFFGDVAQKNDALIKKLNDEQDFSVEQNCWSFTLRNLYSFLRRHDETFSNIEFTQFRQALFKSQINQSVRVHGAKIIIKENLQKVDRSTYLMVWHDGD